MLTIAFPARAFDTNCYVLAAQAGEECIIVPAVTDEVADQRYPNAIRRVKPYLRYVAAPTN